MIGADPYEVSEAAVARGSHLGDRGGLPAVAGDATMTRSDTIRMVKARARSQPAHELERAPRDHAASSFSFLPPTRGLCLGPSSPAPGEATERLPKFHRKAGRERVQVPQGGGQSGADRGRAFLSSGMPAPLQRLYAVGACALAISLLSHNPCTVTQVIPPASVRQVR